MKLYRVKSIDSKGNESYSKKLYDGKGKANAALYLLVTRFLNSNDQEYEKKLLKNAKQHSIVEYDLVENNEDSGIRISKIMTNKIMLSARYNRDVADLYDTLVNNNIINDYEHVVYCHYITSSVKKELVKKLKTVGTDGGKYRTSGSAFAFKSEDDLIKLKLIRSDFMEVSLDELLEI